jgi:hypothetical protein
MATNRNFPAPIAHLPPGKLVYAPWYISTLPDLLSMCK